MGEKLKPCPFCGGEAIIVHINEGENAGGSCVCCTRCLASGNVEFEFKENFVSNWNRRTPPASPSVVADEPEAGEVTVSEDEIEVGARKLADYLYAQPTEEDNVPYDEACPRDQERYREAYRAVRLAAHEAGKREGLEMGARIIDRSGSINASILAAMIRDAIRALSQNGGEGNG